jgi:mono/diheme cytochrome c family protein
MLDKPLGVEGQGFDFPKMVQPILDKNCKSCHTSGHASGFDFTGDLVSNSAAKKSYATSYTSLFKGIGASKSNKAINIATIFSAPPQMPPNSYGARQSGMIKDVVSGTMPKGGTKLSAKDIGILAAWIDLEAPHGGTYDAYMSTSDAQKYQQLAATAQKWFDIETQNCKDYAAWQKATTTIGHGGVNAYASGAAQLRIRYQPTQHVLVSNKVSQGTFMLVDLRGKVISRLKLSHQNTGDVTIPLPASLATGLYIARFEGVNGTAQAKVSITQ